MRPGPASSGVTASTARPTTIRIAKNGGQARAERHQQRDASERDGLPEEVDERQSGVAQFDRQAQQQRVGHRHDVQAGARQRGAEDHRVG